MKVQKVIIRYQVVGLSALKKLNKELDALEKKSKRLGIPKGQIGKIISYNLLKKSE